MKTFCALLISVFLCSISISSAQEHRPFPGCYQAQMYNPPCDSCSDSTNYKKIINYKYCDVLVSYKLKYCFCPEPTCYVDIEYCKVDINACDSLMFYLHPGPEPFINNPLNAEFYYKTFEPAMYKRLVDSLFEEQKENYLCPNRLTYKHFWVGICARVCYADLSNDQLMQMGRIYASRKCYDSSFCCGRLFSYCKDSTGQVDRFIYNIPADVYCVPNPLQPAEECPFVVNQIISMNGEGVLLIPNEDNWVVVATYQSTCTSPCNPGPPIQEE